jgi:hypothetical protein
MLIIYPLLRLIDPIQYRKQQEDRRRKRETPPDVDPDDVELELPVQAVRREKERVCRVCSHRGTGPFCPHCLAETMVPAHK